MSLEKSGIMTLMKGGTMYDQRDIVLIPFPYSDLTGSKLRPALIISNLKLNRTEDRICCLITSNKTEQGIELISLEEGKLPFKSWVKPYRLFTIHEKIIRKKLGKITKLLHKQILASLNEYLSL